MKITTQRFAAAFAALALIAGATSCGKGHNDYSDMILAAGDSVAIPGADKSSGWHTSNRFIAAVNNGAMVAKRYGYVTVSNTDGTAFSVSVTPTVTKGYVDAYLKFGTATINNVKAMYRTHTVVNESDSQVTFAGITGEHVTLIVADFNNDKLTRLTMTLENVDQTELKKYLGERYVYIQSSDSLDYYMSVDGENLITAPPSGSNVNVTFCSNDGVLKLPE